MNVFSQHTTTKPVQLILDTDLGMGFDDVGAIAVLHALADSGAVDIQGIVSSNRYELSVPCIDVLNTYYGRPDIVLGVTKNESAVNISNKLPVKWPEVLPMNYPHRIRTNDEVKEAVTVYRKLLARAEDNSITICCIGFLTNLKDLLLSGPDDYSELSGQELISTKVKQLVVMGGQFPEGREFNFFRDAEAARIVTERWPTEIVFSGSEIGSQVITGRGLKELASEKSPVKEAYVLSVDQSDHYTGMSWDQTAVLVAVKGYEPWYTVERGRCTVAADGSNSWKVDTDGNHLRLIPARPAAEVAEKIDVLMKHLPAK